MQNITREFSGHSSRESITEIPAHLQAVQGQVMPSLDTNTGWEPPDSTKNRAGPHLNTSSCKVAVICHQQTWQQNQNRLDQRVNLKEATRDKSEHHRAAGRSTRTRTRTHWHIQVRQSHRAAFRLMKLSLRFFRNCNPEAAPGGVHQTDVKRGDVSFRLEFCQTFVPEPESVSPGVSQRRSVSELLLDWSKDTFSHCNTCCPAQICGNDG